MRFWQVWTTCLVLMVFMVQAEDVPARDRESLRVAVAANFAVPARALVELFSERTGIMIRLAVGSTGRHYAQIRNGAPFDLFLAADSRRPRLLEEEGVAVAGTRFTYARGILVLWSPDPDLVDNQGKILRHPGRFSRLALANPKLAPYGAAAQEAMTRLGVWQSLSGRLVLGENVAQAYQFIRSSGADLGFVALAQVETGSEKGSCWRVPDRLYTPIVQQGVLLRESKAGRALLAFFRSEEAGQLIRSFGYQRP